MKRDIDNLRHLQTFALPIIDSMADWPDASTWGEWLVRFLGLRTPDTPPMSAEEAQKEQIRRLLSGAERLKDRRETVARAEALTTSIDR